MTNRAPPDPRHLHGMAAGGAAISTPSFEVIVRVREIDAFPTLRDELVAPAGDEPDESTGYEGIVDFHWGGSPTSPRPNAWPRPWAPEALVA